MKIKSVAGITCVVGNLNKTVKFYEALGFEARKRDANHATVYSNWFWIDFVAADKETRTELKKTTSRDRKGAGPLVYLSVEDVDGFHKALSSKGLRPASEPRDYVGNREFVLRDPDGYGLVIFKRK